MAIDPKKLKKFIKNYKPYDPLKACKEGHHSDECVNMSGGKIWWKCRHCGRVESTEDRPFTI